MTADVTATRRKQGTGGRPSPPSESPGQAPTTVIRPSKGWRSLNLRELWEYRELLYFFVWKDIKIRYKQTVLGVAWAVLQPVMLAVVFYFLFTGVAGLKTLGIPPFAFYLAGVIPWNVFSRGLTDASMSLAENQALVTKVYFPRVLLPVAATLAALVDFVIGLGILAVVLVYYQIVPTLYIAILPLFTLFAAVAGVGISLWLSALNVKYRDVRYTIPFLTQIWMFATPVGYATVALPAFVPLWAYSLNPMAGVIEGFRWALFGSAFAFDASSWISVVMVLAIFLGGLVYFRRSERTFADVV